MVLVFEKKENFSILCEDDVNEIFIVACSSQPVAENWIAEHLPSMIDNVIYKSYMVWEVK
jgi:hypothetical protein